MDIKGLIKIIILILTFPFWIIIMPLITSANCDEYFIDGYIKGYNDCRDGEDFDYHKQDIKDHFDDYKLWISLALFVAYSVVLFNYASR